MTLLFCYHFLVKNLFYLLTKHTANKYKYIKLIINIVKKNKQQSTPTNLYWYLPNQTVQKSSEPSSEGSTEFATTTGQNQSSIVGGMAGPPPGGQGFQNPLSNNIN